MKGFVCTDVAATVYGTDCPLLVEDQIRDAEWDSSRLWTPLSITASRVTLVVVWLLAFLALTGVLGAFVVRQRGEE